MSSSLVISTFSGAVTSLKMISEVTTGMAYNLTPDGSPIQDDMAGKRVGLDAETHKAVKIAVRALFLKDKKALEKIISEREKQLDRIISKPSALPGREN